jgi:hypothetical protein
MRIAAVRKALLLTFEVMATNASAILAGILVFLVPPIAKLSRAGWSKGWPAVKASLAGDAGLGIAAALVIWTIVFIFNLGRAKEKNAAALDGCTTNGRLHEPGTVETAEERYWNTRLQAEAPELAHKIITGYTAPAVKETEPYLAIAYVGEWHEYIEASDPDEEPYNVFEEFFKFTTPATR